MKGKRDAPPSAAAWILARIARKEDRLSILDDFSEIHEELVAERGPGGARRWYWAQILRSLLPFVFNNFCWSFIMFRNYAKVALRNIRRHWGYSLINIAGLAVGFACCFLISLWVIDELSFDAFHKDVGRICHVLAYSEFENPITPTLLGPILQEEFPEIAEAVRFHYFFGGDMLAANDRVFYESGIRIADSTFFELFSFPFLKGNPQTALEDPHSIVISKATAEKYFPGEDPLGKTMTLNREHEFTVSGVIENVPANSTLQFDMIVPMAFRIATAGAWYLEWNSFYPQTFVKLRPGCRGEELNGKIADVIRAHGGGEVKISLLPFRERRFHLYSDIAYVYIFSATAIFVLAIAWFNFINLATARSADRAKEIGMRKISGAFRTHILSQFLGESLFLSFAAFCGALLLTALLLPSFNALTGKGLAMSHGPLIPIGAFFALLTGLAAGVYPALFLSGFEPVKVIKGELRAGVKSSRLRKSLVVVQFSLSILLTIGVLVVHKQLGFARRVGTGYDRENLVLLAMKGGSKASYEALKRGLLENPRILGVTGMRVRLPYFSWRQDGFHWEGRDPGQPGELSTNMVNYDFIKTFRIELVEGRDFARDYPSDAASSCLINEELARLMGLQKAEGRELRQGDRSYRIIGVMKDFHFQTLSRRIEPLVLRLEPEVADIVGVRISPGSVSAAVADIKKTWERLIPDYPFAYSFFDDVLESGYNDTERTGTILNAFTFLAVIISCLGLFGLASFTAEQRTKEVGIRKVLGSSVPDIISLLTKEYLKCIAWANLAAWPVAYFIMHGWLRKFAYRAEIGIGPFLLSAAAAFAIAVVTVSRQAIVAARANPIDSLRYE
jgi:putative ABC transport system permease protein